MSALEAFVAAAAGSGAAVVFGLTPTERRVARAVAARGASAARDAVLAEVYPGRADDQAQNALKKIVKTMRARLAPHGLTLLAEAGRLRFAAIGAEAASPDGRGLRAGDVDWTDARVGALVGLAVRGVPDREIAERLGLPERAVKAKRHRLGLSGARRAAGIDFDWTEARVAELERLAAAGFTGAMIAERLGVPRGAVLGKCRRKNIVLKGGRSKPPAPVAGARGVRFDRPRVGQTGIGFDPALRAARAEAAAAARRAALAEPAETGALGPAAVTLFDVRPAQCRFPLWPGATPPADRAFFCGEPIAGGGRFGDRAPYCAAHAGLCLAGRSAAA